MMKEPDREMEEVCERLYRESEIRGLGIFLKMDEEGESSVSGLVVAWQGLMMVIKEDEPELKDFCRDLRLQRRLNIDQRVVSKESREIRKHMHCIIVLSARRFVLNSQLDHLKYRKGRFIYGSESIKPS